ncbi:MAG: outer membrane protein assembly factor BamA [Paludibacteraceae bacterium]|jgi:outer membrane protein insertion porin family|nr:outer membrane protein assembly factor BamA [Paludibacteraceae bacterium]
MNKISIFFILITLLLCLPNNAKAQIVANQPQQQAVEIDYSLPLGTKTIADIKVTGSENYEEYVLIGFSGLSIGQQIKIPGDEITAAIKRFWKQGYFSDVKILATQIRNDSVWLEIHLKQRPRISQINYFGLKKSEQEDIEAKLNISKGNQLTPDLIDRTKIIIKKAVAEKGYHNAEVAIYQKNDPQQPGSIILDISIDKKAKVKVHEIYVTGNKALSLNKIDKAMKKTNRPKNFMNIFRSKKYIAKEYENDKKSLIAKYNEVGYRDAVIVYDSVAKYDDNHVDVYLDIDEGEKYYFRNIKWTGNTLYASEFLNQVLNIQRGDVYNLKQLNKRLNEDEDAVSTLYRDNGYLFFNIDPVEINIENDSIDYEMRIYEGKPATINKINIVGNTRLYEHVIRRELRTKPGNLYSQSDLVRTLRELAQMKQFDEEKLFSGVDIQPNPEDGTVDITYNLETKSSDQIEFSAGYGQSGVVFSLALKFTNFAIQNLFKPEMYKILPQGEGQTFSIRAQTNGIYYQNYSISFYEPWLGGKRPNSFSLSAYYSIQTGLSKRYQNAYNDNINNYYYGSSDYSSYSYSNYDKNIYLRTLGIAATFGQRLNWPDDYFSFYGELSYQRYDCKDWPKAYFGFSTGVSNNLSLGLTLIRNSISNPIYTRRGSSFSVSLHITPPYSAFDGKDYENMASDDPQRYEWIEYHKWKINAKMFIPVTKDEKLVLMARADYGFLGYFNKNKRSPFEKFYVGGDGMSGYTTAGTETIGLRGYEAGALTPISDGVYNGNLYSKLTLELRYPILLKEQTTIWALAFVEAGNCWSEFQDFNPFDLKRSAGAGVRVYLPMFGLLGVDWGWGFDPINGSTSRSGSHFNFILGQEF